MSDTQIMSPMRDEKLNIKQNEAIHQKMQTDIACTKTGHVRRPDWPCKTSSKAKRKGEEDRKRTGKTASNRPWLL